MACRSWFGNNRGGAPTCHHGNADRFSWWRMVYWTGRSRRVRCNGNDRSAQDAPLFGMVRVGVRAILGCHRRLSHRRTVVFRRANLFRGIRVVTIKPRKEARVLGDCVAAGQETRWSRTSRAHSSNPWLRFLNRPASIWVSIHRMMSASIDTAILYFMRQSMICGSVQFW